MTREPTPSGLKAVISAYGLVGLLVSGVLLSCIVAGIAILSILLWFLHGDSPGQLLLLGVLVVAFVGYWGSVLFAETNGLADWNRDPPDLAWDEDLD